MEPGAGGPSWMHRGPFWVTGRRAWAAGREECPVITGWMLLGSPLGKCSFVLSGAHRHHPPRLSPNDCIVEPCPSSWPPTSGHSPRP